MAYPYILKNGILGLFLVASLAARAQKVSPVTKAGVEVGKEMKIFDGDLYYSTADAPNYKLWACDVVTKKSKLVMKSKENFSHFFLMDKTLLFTTDNGHAGEDGRLYYLDEHKKPLEVVMKDEAGPDVEPENGRKLEIYNYRHGFLILAPMRDMKAKYKLYRFNPKQDSARLFFPENFFVRQGLCPSPDGKMIIAAVEVTPPHPWENQKSFWNKYSQLFVIHNDGGQPYEKWMDHAEFHNANFSYTKRTWLNLHYKELKDKGEDVFHHTIFVVTNPSEKKGTLPKLVGEAADSSLFQWQGKITYYFGYKGNIYLVTAFEYPESFKLKYGKLSGHNMADFSRIHGQFAFDDVLYIVTEHKAANEYFDVWTMRYKFDTAAWLEGNIHSSMPVNYDEKLSSTMPSASPLKAYHDTLGNPIYLGANTTLYMVGKTGAAPVTPNGHALSNINDIANCWQGNFVMKQKGGDADQLVLNCKTGAGAICSPGDKYQPGFDFECNGHLFFGVFTARTTKLINWHSDGTVEGTHRLDILDDLTLQLDFSKPYIDGNRVFLLGRNVDKVESKPQLFVLEM